MLDLRHRLHEIIFEADTPAGKAFDIFLIVCIILSVFAVMMETVSSFSDRHGTFIVLAEWFFTILFTAEYALRIWTVKKPKNYIFSFFGIIDLLSIIPTYLSLFIPGTQSLIIIRSIRLLRVFRVLKLTRYLGEAKVLTIALKASQAKITVFLVAVFIAVSIVGTLMYLIEGAEGGFTSIPTSVYWAIVTVTTVGYGDVSPITPLGQILASVLMFLGYGILAVPTGIVSLELSRAHTGGYSSQHCKHCMKESHASDAKYCKYCSEEL